jgi:ATP-dependent phosphoenolpyruvate carboxykinase
MKGATPFDPHAHELTVAGMRVPRRTWSDGAAYDAAANRLAGLFGDNFKQFEAAAGADVRADRTGLSPRCTGSSS